MAPRESKEEFDEVRVLGPLRALAALLPQNADAKSQFSVRAANKLNESERRAVDEFAIAGQQCLSKLNGETIAELGRICAGTRALAKGRRSFGTIGGESSVYELFDRMDVNKDGFLSSAEFKAAMGQLKGEKLSEQELERVVEASDVNKDGRVDIHEFTVWLYRGDADEPNGDASPQRPTPGEPEKAPPPSPASTALLEKVASLEAELHIKERALATLEDKHEEEVESTHDFWRSIAQHCVLTIDQKVDLSTSEWLGNGKYGFVLKARRRKDNRELVVKMMGVRWAHLAVQEWQSGTKVGKHRNIVDYEDVMLHADNDDSVQNMLKIGYEAGKLQSRKKRTKFPDRYICLTQELMNRGTVQDWIDKDLLSPGGMFSVMQGVASGLAYMYAQGFVHNDIKPENIMLHQETHGAAADVEVKLGDLGLAQKSTDTSTDVWQYGMTVFCMFTGTPFGTLKYYPERISDFVAKTATACSASASQTSHQRIAQTLNEMPELLRRIFLAEIAMIEVSTSPSLQEWSFSDGGDLAHDRIQEMSAEAPATRATKSVRER